MSQKLRISTSYEPYTYSFTEDELRERLELFAGYLYPLYYGQVVFPVRAVTDAIESELDSLWLRNLALG
jgi:hypothetical protein